MRKASRRARVAAWMIGLTGAGVCALVLMGASSPAKTEAGFRSPAGDKVVTLRAAAPLSPDEARAALASVSAAPGSLAVAVIYQGAAVSPGDRLALAPDLPSAMALIANPPYDRWSHRLRINPAGQRTYD